MPTSTTADPVPAALIVGASRGLGLALAAELATRGWNVIGTAWDVAGTPLNELAPSHPDRVRVDMLDVASPGGIAGLRERLTDRTLDLLFVNAGTRTGGRARSRRRDCDGGLHAGDGHKHSRPDAGGRDVESLVPADGLIGAMSSGQGSVAKLRERNARRLGRRLHQP